MYHWRVVLMWEKDYETGGSNWVQDAWFGLGKGGRVYVSEIGLYFSQFIIGQFFIKTINFPIEWKEIVGNRTKLINW